MNRALNLLGAVLLVCAALVAVSPEPAAYLTRMPVAVVLTIGVVFAAEVASRFVLGYPSQRGGVHPPAHGRLVLVALLALGAQAILSMRGPAGSPWTVLAYYVVLAGAGVALARWCRSSEHSPVLLATALFVVWSAGAILSFGLDPMAELQYGAQRWIVATWEHAARTLRRLPLDAAVAWAGWHIFAIRGSIADAR